MTTIVIMPGGFHPFHAGHAALYQSAQRAFPDAEVFIAATNDTSSRPFPFAVKEKLAKLAGVEAGHFVQVKSPFRAEEITAGFDPARDTLIFVRSEKDSTKPPQPGGVKKDGSPSYLQPLLGAKRLEPFAKHAYMAYLPTVEFGPGMTSATEIRSAWPQLNEKRKTALVMSLYPRTQGNAKLAATVVGLLDAAIGTQGVAEGLDEAVGGNYLYHATGADGLKGMLSSGSIKAAFAPQDATKAQTRLPTVSLTRDWGYASGSNAGNQMAGIGRDAILVLDRSAIENNFKTLGTSQSTNIKGLAFNPYLKKDVNVARSQNTDPMARANAKAKAKYAEPTAKAGGEFEEAVVVPKGALPLKGTMVGFWVNPKSELMKDPAIMNDPRRLDMVRPNQFVKAKQQQGVAEAFDKPYRSKTEKSETGSFDVLARLPDGTNLSIMFNNEGNDEWQVEFYRNNSQEVTGEGDAQRIFATVLNAIQKFITKHKPAHLTFAASKETDPSVHYEPGEPQPNPASRAKLYDRLVQRYAKAWGYRAFRADNGHIVMYELSRINKQGVAEGSGPQVGDAVYYGKRLVGWFKGYSEHGKIITEPNEEEMGDEYSNRDVYWDQQDKITIRPEQGMTEAAKKCPPATQDIGINLENRQKAIDEYGYGPLNPDLPNTKFWMKKVDEWNLDSMEEAQQSLCGNCAAFDVRQDTLDCIAQGIDSESPEDAEGVIDAGDLGYCKFLKFKCASRRTCDAWVTGGPLVDKPVDENQGWAATYEDSRVDLATDTELTQARRFAKQHYPEFGGDEDLAFAKWVQRGLGHSEKNDKDHDRKLKQLTAKVDNMQLKIQQQVKNPDYMEESSRKK